MKIRNTGDSKTTSLYSVTSMILLNYLRLAAIHLFKISTIKTWSLTNYTNSRLYLDPACEHPQSLLLSRLGIPVITTLSCSHTWAVVGYRLVEAREGPKIGMLTGAGWRGTCGTRQSCQALALCHQQWALMLPGKLKKKSQSQWSRIEVLREALRTTETQVEAGLWQQAWTAMHMESEVRPGFKSRSYHL